MKHNKQSEEVPCTRCGEKFKKISSSSNNISSFIFPQYIIQRYGDFNSPPREVNLCVKCSDQLDRFLYIYTDGKDYYREIEEQNNGSEGE